MAGEYRATPPDPNRLLAEVKSIEESLPGRHDASMIELGCEGCLNSVGHSSGAHPLSELQIMMDKACDENGKPIPATFVLGRFTCINVAEGCPVDQQSQKPICRFSKQAMNSTLARAFQSAHESRIKERE